MDKNRSALPGRFSFSGLDISLISDYTIQYIKYEIGPGEVFVWEDKTNELLRAFNRIDKELDDVYHEVALRMNISDSAFTIFYIIHELGDGCLQKDICREAFGK